MAMETKKEEEEEEKGNNRLEALQFKKKLELRFSESQDRLFALYTEWPSPNKIASKRLKERMSKKSRRNNIIHFPWK
ncbi:hypothetical protein BLOT_012266 [Blomia tropicalis]|nr:hypothetical protein BLOT_012266 [Blomia tropicalis]